MKNKILVSLILALLFVVVGFTYNCNTNFNNNQVIKKTDSIINSVTQQVLTIEQQVNYKFTGYSPGYLLWIIPSDINVEQLVEKVRIDD
ncbi:hypothetical protein IMX26_06855 [Clostridium sp. 'deep sea']|uniref:hypothetical protein n=1 Tax=Clostridium sp. 'deep sea' TaxID=2779445 RepID=UPI001896A306|nr:hypothetical protein [Clostridium sp. 'deep sea']QOR36523.1 hypothetical protein IMX26_06855 [Clostridium sp. 'deep sea']